MSATHEAVRELSGLYILDGLAPADFAEFQAHLAVCEECRAEVASLRPVVAALPRTVPQVQPSPELRRRVIQTVSGRAARASQGVGENREKRGLVLWLAAASLIGAVALGAYAIQLRGRVSDLESRLQRALTEASLAERQIADARRVALEAQSQVAVLAAPDVVRIDLVGQPVAPSASARAFWSRSRGMVFTASKLPSLPAGRVYQLWVLTAAGPPISVGVLQPEQAGTLAAVFQTPSDIPQPTQVAVSDEPAGGVPSPTGTIWVAGKPVA